MENPKFFRFPFAALGDKSAIEDAIQTNGTISYAEGYGYDYERNPAADSQAKRIERDKMNQLQHDITNNIRQYQLYGAPWFYDASYNDGVALAYPKGAIVRFNNGESDNIYCSLCDNNTATPIDESKWVLADPNIYAAQDGSRNYAEISGTENELIATLNPAPSQLTTGMTINIFTKKNNTGFATLNLNDLGAKKILYNDGSALMGNDWNDNSLLSLIYDGVDAWRIVTSQAYINSSINNALSIKQDNLEKIADINFASNCPESDRNFNFYQSTNNVSSIGTVIKRQTGENGALRFQQNGKGNIEFFGNGSLNFNDQKIWFGGREQYTENGYVILPNGMIWQWGKIYNIVNNEQRNITLPMAFPHAFLNVTGSFETINFGIGTYIQAFSLLPLSLSTMEMRVCIINNYMAHHGFWQAIGY